MAATRWWARSSRAWTWSTSSRKGRRRKTAPSATRTACSRCKSRPMPNEEAGMRPIAALLAIAAIAGGEGLLAAAPAYAQCSVFSRHPCVPNVCSVLSRHPCVPQPLYPFGENLQLTILSAASEQNPPTPGATIDSSPEGTSDTDRRLDTIRDLFGALRACWVPPPQDEARPGMQMSVRLSFKRGGQMIGAPRVTYTSPDAPPGGEKCV